MSDKIITIAAALKNQGYSTGQFGKNHLGDLNSMLPTAHGFDEFFGNLYHLNAQEDPENPDYPSKKEFPKFFETFGPRGVIHSYATDKDDTTVEPRWGKVGKQKIEDTGPLNTKRMETCDDEFVAAAARPRSVRATSFSTSVTTGTYSACASTTGRWSSWSSGAMGRCRSGRTVYPPSRTETVQLAHRSV
jgi:arylsulfatase A-like enzyme